MNKIFSFYNFSRLIAIVRNISKPAECKCKCLKYFGISLKIFGPNCMALKGILARGQRILIRDYFRTCD